VPETGIIIGLIGAILFRIRNADKRFLNIISGLILLIFSFDFLYIVVLDNKQGLIYSFTVGGLLIIFYSIRFTKKDKRQTIDYLKLVAVLLISIHPFSFIYQDSYWGQVIGFIAIPFSFIIYLYDRFILKPETMKKKFIIILTIQTVLIGLFLIYAFIQKLEADKQLEYSMMERDRAVILQKEAEELRAKMDEEINKLKEEIKNCR
jgi:hypothetical protein